MITALEFQNEMGTAEFHYHIGKYAAERERRLGVRHSSVLAAAYRYGVPIYTSAPGDSSIGMNIAAMALQKNKLKIDISRDVNETAAIVWNAKHRGGKSGVLVFGGGSPRNFVLQTEPQIQEVLGITENGHDYFLQFTDARSDTGGLSAATPAEAVTRGKIDPDKLPNAVVCYLDATVAMPVLAAYALSKHKSRKLKRLYDLREEMFNELRCEYDRRSSREKTLKYHYEGKKIAQ